MPVTPTVSTRMRPDESLNLARGLPFKLSVAVGVIDSPCTLVHCLSSSPVLSGLTRLSFVPCQMARRGHVPVKVGFAARTRSPHCCGVRLRPGVMHGEYTWFLLVVQS